MRRPLIAGNWKMNTTLAQARQLASEIAAGASFDLDLLVCPPFPWLAAVQAEIAGSQVLLGAQNCWTEPSGAFTGEVAPEMAAEHCSHVIVGHSERRAMHGESDALVAEKAGMALASGLVPIVCVGETLSERDSGETDAVVTRQLGAVIFRLGPAVERCVVAYEPVWAIGTGKTASPPEVQALHLRLRTLLCSASTSGDSIRILYGGSVKPDNAAELFAQVDIDGGLIGGASLKAADFVAICRAAR